MNIHVMLHTKKFRALSGEARYYKVITSVQHKIMDITELSPAALPLINDALWDSNPLISYTDDRNEGVLHLRKAAGFFEILAQYIKLPEYKHTDKQEAGCKKYPERLHVYEPTLEELRKNSLVRWYYSGRAFRQRNNLETES